MERATVLIGVKKIGNLPELQAVTPSVQSMAEWARSQGLDEKLIQVVTDENGPVSIQQIKTVIKQLVDRTTVDQLIVYFSGHGFNIESEFWLLSDAPGDTNAAVNVEGSVRLARYCGISHVVLISDACRSAAEGLQALQVRGSEVFPNEPASGTEKPVDILFACARGKPSLEVSDPGKAVAEAAKSFSALYTEVLLEYLNGKYQDVLHRVRDEGKYVGLLRLGELADRLKKNVPERLKAKLGVDPQINQYPDDRISRHTGNAWLARIPLIGRGKSPSRAGAPVIPVSRSTLLTPFSVADRLVSVSLEGDLRKWKDLLSLDIGSRETILLQRAIAIQAAPFGPVDFETGCGFKVRGARVVRTAQHGVGVEHLSTEGSVIRVNGVTPQGSNVLIVLENGSGVVVPVLPDFIAALSFDGSQLVDVSYDPSANSSRWSEYAARAAELRSLRASIAVSAGLGVLRLNEEGHLALAKRMQLAKGVDPSLALYAAYAYDSLQQRDLIDEMRAFMVSDLGLTLFDVALLSSGLKVGRIIPPFPMLSQGWALLSAYRVELPLLLRGIEQHRLPSLWTVFDKTGVATLEAAMLSGEIR